LSKTDRFVSGYLLKIRAEIVYFFVALARLLYGFEGSMGHYWFHSSDYAIAAYASAAVTIVIMVALLLPLSQKLAFVFAGINAASGLAGFAIMGWLYISGNDPTVTNPVLAPLVGGIVFSALLYYKPVITTNLTNQK
jgi:hypothetical protein